MDEMIKTVFSEMVEEIQKTSTASCEPNRYHEAAAISEINQVYHFCKQFEKKSSNCAVYLEFPCDSGRVDAVVLYENNILFIEAKSHIDNKKHKILNAQACRFENRRENLKVPIDKFKEHDAYVEKYLKDSSLRDTLKERVHSLMIEKFGVKDAINIYSILLSTAMNEYAKNKWDYRSNGKHYEVYNLNCIADNYIILDEIKDKQHPVWYLGAYKKIDTID